MRIRRTKEWVDEVDERRERSIFEQRGLCFFTVCACIINFLALSPSWSQPVPPDLPARTIMNATKKRKLDSTRADDAPKKLKMSSASAPVSIPVHEPSKLPAQSSENAPPDVPDYSAKTAESKGKVDSDTARDSQSNKKRRRINKLAPPRPFPTVPTSVSGTGPRSSHKEGKNMICLTRKTSLSNYMRRCKDVILVDGYVILLPSSNTLISYCVRYKTLHLSAMGAAIPLLTQLICALPPILPFSQDEIHTEINTGTIEVQDEVLPEDENEDLTYQTRGKSVLRVVFKIGDGEFNGDKTASRKYSAGKTIGKNYTRAAGNKGTNKKDQQTGTAKATVKTSEVVFEEPEQDYMDMI